MPVLPSASLGDVAEASASELPASDRVPLGGLSTAGAVIFALANGTTVANLYYIQPLLAQIARSFSVPDRDAGFVAVVMQIGYAVGILAFVPLGDILNRRTLVLGLLAVVTCSLLGAAFAPSLALLAVATLAIGVTTVIPQVLMPFAADLASPQQRGKAIGIIQTGMAAGVLLARSISGALGAAFGWRSVFAVAAASMVGIAMMLARSLPHRAPRARVPYPELLASLWTQLRSERELRKSCLTGITIFGAFSAFWTTIAFLLAAPPFNYGTDVVGWLGLTGVLGVFAASFIGRAVDRLGPDATNVAGVATSLASFTLFAFGANNLAMLVVGSTVLALANSLNQISNQARIFSLDAAARSRLNTVYMFATYSGGAIGSLLGASAWHAWGWSGVCSVGLVFGVAAAAVMASYARR